MSKVFRITPKRIKRFFVFHSFFRNFADESAKILILGIKKNEFFLFCSRFFVTLSHER